MNLDMLKKHKENASAIIQTTMVIGFSIILTLLRGSIDNSGFDLTTFCTTFIITNYMKIVYIERSSKLAMKDDGILQKKISITQDRNYFYENNLLEELEDEVKWRNNIAHLNAIVNHLHGTKNKKKQRMLVWASQYLLAYKKQDVERLKELDQFNLKSIKIKYEKINIANIFNFGSVNVKDEKTYNFNKRNAVLARSILPLIASGLFSYFFSVITIEGYITSGEIFLDLGTHLVSLITGIYTGNKIGTQVILEDYVETLENNASLIRDIKKTVMVKQNVREDR